MVRDGCWIFSDEYRVCLIVILNGGCFEVRVLGT